MQKMHIIKVGKADLVYHHAVGVYKTFCGLMIYNSCGVDEIQHFVLMIYNSCGVDEIQHSVLMIYNSCGVDEIQHSVLMIYTASP